MIQILTLYKLLFCRFFMIFISVESKLSSTVQVFGLVFFRVYCRLIFLSGNGVSGIHLSNITTTIHRWEGGLLYRNINTSNAICRTLRSICFTCLQDYSPFVSNRCGISNPQVFIQGKFALV